MELNSSVASAVGPGPGVRPHIAVIGAGPMGLAAAWRLAQAGAQVTVLERDDRIGGMSAHIDFAGTRLERYYHFVCKPDLTTFAWLRELGLQDRLRWVDTHMGYYFNGRLHDWGHPLALLKFPGLSLIQKLRYAAHVMHAKGVRDWRPYDRFSSTDWLTRWLGQEAYEVMWKRLFHYKFYELENELSAAWLGTRIQRVALSRKSLFQESLGYIDGGSELLLDAVAKRFLAAGGRIELGAEVQQVVIDRHSQRVTGVQVKEHGQSQVRPVDAVVSTIPLPYLVQIAPGLPPSEAAQVAAIRNVGVVCVLLKLKRPFTRNFWLNINQDGIQIPGLIEYSNLNPLDGSKILYAPFYMPQTHPKWQNSHEAFIEETITALQRMRPDWQRSEVIAATASRYQYAQTVCSPGFRDALPPMKSAVAGLVLADTSHYYPEDRSISESLRIGEELARLVASPRP
jgi:protoporphyrinogen oxidase